MKQPVDTDYPLSEVPAGARKGLWSTAILLFGFTFFTVLSLLCDFYFSLYFACIFECI